MPLPQLKVADYSNALNNAVKMQEIKASREDRKATAGQRNQLFELQKRKLEDELSPESKQFEKAQRNAILAGHKVKQQGDLLDNQKKLGIYIGTSLKNTNLDDDTLTGLTKFREYIDKDPNTKSLLSSLPNPDDWLEPDLLSDTGYRVPKDKMPAYKAIMQSYIDSANAVSQGKKAYKREKIWIPKKDGGWRSEMVSIANTDDFDPTTIHPEATLDDPTKEDSTTDKAAKRMSDISKDFNKLTKDGDFAQMAIDKRAGTSAADEYNKLAEKSGSSLRYKWQEDLNNPEPGLTNDAKNWVKKKLGMSTEDVGGWTLVDTSVNEETADTTENKSRSIKGSSYIPTEKSADGTLTGKIPNQPKPAIEAKEITTKAEYDKLPSGAVYLEGGKPFRKP